jgi:RNA polymerase sigma-70 factor (ECF subfamily)
VSPSRVDALFREHGADVLAYALRRTDAGSAEDVVAEVFLTAWRRADRVPDREPVLWLYAVARRVLANQRRATRRREALVDVLGTLTRRHSAAPEPGGSPLTAALGRLRPDDREVLMLIAWEGLDAKQAATVSVARRRPSIPGCIARARGSAPHSNGRSPR